MDREAFIADTAARILASMYSVVKERNPASIHFVMEEKNHDIHAAINAAVELWDELVRKNIIHSGDE